MLSPSGVFHPPEQNYLSGTPHLKCLPSAGTPPRLSEKERSQTQILCQAADPVRIQHLFGGSVCGFLVFNLCRVDVVSFSDMFTREQILKTIKLMQKLCGYGKN